MADGDPPMHLDHREMRDIAKDLPMILMPLRVEEIPTRTGKLASYSVFRHLPDEVLSGALQADRGRGNRAVGALVGFAMADSVAAPWRHTPAGEAARGIGAASPLYSLEKGQFTDNTSLALCVAESLLVREGYEPTDARGRYYHWWHSGYCSSLGEAKPSEGLRPSLGRSFNELLVDPNARFVQPSAGEDAGSLVGAVVVPLFFHQHPEYAIAVSQHQSYGREGSEVVAACCATLSFVLLRLVTREEGSDSFQQCLDRILQEWLIWMEAQVFPHPQREMWIGESHRERALEIITGIATGETGLPWRAKSLSVETYISRSAKPVHTIGQTATEALTMALHAAYHAKEYSEAVQRAVAIGGDADMVAAITGALWGAYSGYHHLLEETETATWYREMAEWDKGRVRNLGILLYLRGPEETQVQG